MSDIATGLIAHYKCNDCDSNGAVVDSIGNSNGTSVRNTSLMFAAGKVGRCFTFDGSSDKITVSPGPTGMKSVALWFKASAASFAGLVYEGNDSSNSQPSNWPWAIWLGSSAVWWSGNTDGSGQNYSYTPNTWYHIVLVRDDGNGNALVYINGALFWTGTGQAWSGDETLRMGGSGSNYCDASIDDVRIYNRTLSVADVLALYNGGVGTEEEINKTPNPLCHWKMNDNAGSLAIADATGFRNAVGQRNTNLYATTGKVGGALEFKHTANPDCGVFTPVNLGTKYSLAVWFKSNAAAHHSMMSQQESWYGCILMISDSEYWLYSSTESEETRLFPGEGCVWDANWHHWVMTRDGAMISFYQDGNYLGQTTLNNGAAGVHPGWIGQYSPSILAETWAAHGKIDDLRLYNRTLSVADIAAIYNGGTGTEAAPASNGLICHYKCNDNAAGTVVADSINEMHGVAQQNTSALTTTGKIDKALSFNGTTDYVELPYSNLPGGDDPVSWFGWVKTTSAGGTCIFGYGGIPNTANTWRELYQNFYGYGLYFAGNNNDFGASCPSINDGDWHHVGYVYSGSGAITIYRDGVAYAGTISALNTPLQFAALGLNSESVAKFEGTMDDVRIYNRALTAGEVAAIYNGGAGTEYEFQTNALVAQWKMNDNAASLVVADATGRNNGVAARDTSNIATTGKVGGALNFNGTTDIVSIQPVPSLTQYTWAGWMKLANLTHNHTLAGTSGDGYGTALMLVPGGNYIYSSNAGEEVAKAVTTWDTNWHHWCVTRDGTTFRFYRDGILLGDGTASMNTPIAPNQLGVYGNPGETWRLEGALDDVRFYSRPLNAAEVFFLYNNGAGTEADLPLVPGLDGLVAHYKCNDNAENQIVVENISGLNGTTGMNTSAHSVGGRINNALHFDGGGASGQTPADSLLHPTKAYTYALWFAVDAGMASQQDVFGNYDDKAICLILVPGSGTFTGYFWFTDASGTQYYIQWSMPVDTNWHHFVATWDGTIIRCYVDNNFVGDDGLAATLPGLACSLHLGMGGITSQSSNLFVGSIDDIRIYNRALSLAEIAQIYNGGLGTEADSFAPAGRTWGPFPTFRRA